MNLVAISIWYLGSQLPNICGYAWMHMLVHVIATSSSVTYGIFLFIVAPESKGFATLEFVC